MYKQTWLWNTKSCEAKVAFILSVVEYCPLRKWSYWGCCSICKMPTAIAPDDPECLKLKDSMETGFNHVGTMPTGVCTHIHAHTTCTNTNWHRCGHNCAQAHKHTEWGYDLTNIWSAKNKLQHTQSYKCRYTLNK